MEQRRYGHPRTDKERRRRHKSLFGTEALPARGTGLKRKKNSFAKIFKNS